MDFSPESAHERPRGHSGRGNRGQRIRFLQKRLAQGAALLRLVASQTGVDGERHHVVAVETRVHGTHVVERLDQQSRSHQDQCAEAHLRRDQHPPRQQVPRGCAAASESARDVGARTAPGRR